MTTTAPRLVCRFCMFEKAPNLRGYRAALRAAAVVSNPPARVSTSWLCPNCDRMNTTAEPEQRDLFTQTRKAK